MIYHQIMTLNIYKIPNKLLLSCYDNRFQNAQIKINYMKNNNEKKLYEILLFTTCRSIDSNLADPPSSPCVYEYLARFDRASMMVQRDLRERLANG
jgi:hypothetical protein